MPPANDTAPLTYIRSKDDSRHCELSGFTLKSSYRAALGRARVAVSWEDRLDALTTAERLRHRILAEKGQYRVSVADYSMKPVCAKASRQAVRRVFSADGASFPPFSSSMSSRLAGLRTDWFGLASEIVLRDAA